MPVARAHKPCPHKPEDLSPDAGALAPLPCSSARPTSSALVTALASDARAAAILVLGRPLMRHYTKAAPLLVPNYQLQHAGLSVPADRALHRPQPFSLLSTRSLLSSQLVPN